MFAIQIDHILIFPTHSFTAVVDNTAYIYVLSKGSSLYYLILQAAKEEVIIQLTTANNRVESQQAQIIELRETVSNLTREKHALETELNVVRVGFLFFQNKKSCQNIQTYTGIT